jgi:predicted nucleotidyltransferase
MKPENPTPFLDLNTVLHDLTKSVTAILGDNLIGLYLQGSFAVGDFDEHSDVDFLAIIQHELTTHELAALQAMHQRIFALLIPWAQHLEGSYFPIKMLGRYEPKRDRPFYLDNGSQELIRSDHDNTWVVRWTVREHGIPLFGPPPDEIIDPIPPKAMHQEIIKTMHDWAEEIFSGSYQIDSRWAQPFAVMSYCRMLQTLSNGRIESKKAGVIWAQNNLAQEWQPLIQQAWQERPNPWEKVYQPIRPEATAEAHAFIRYALTLAGSTKI